MFKDPTITPGKENFHETQSKVDSHDILNSKTLICMSRVHLTRYVICLVLAMFQYDIEALCSYVVPIFVYEDEFKCVDADN